MLPGKQYTPEDYLRILWRHKWLVIVPLVIIMPATFIGTQILPNVYRSDARIVIVPQQVPQRFVQPTVTTTINDRLQAINEQIQSRTRLERLIQELNLYEEERRTMIMEDVVQLMRRNISIQLPQQRGRGDPNSFTVSFTSQNARLAMQVTERLASQFITESLQDRTVQADQTTQFLETQLEDARRKLIDHEEKLAQFRRRYAGQLPSQVQSNLAVMQSTQTQLQNIATVINRDRDRQLVLEKIVGDLMALGAAAFREQGPSSKATQAPPTAASQLEAARGALQDLQVRLKPEHPDLIRTQRVVRELEDKAAAEELSGPVGVGVGATQSVLAPADQKRLAEMQAEHESLERRIAGSRAEEVRLQAVLSNYRTKVEAAPNRETEETDLMRDYSTLQGQYQALLDRSQQSRIAADLERRQIGEQFRLIEPARLPERPVSPDRVRLNILGALAGLGIGLALIALVEYRNTSFRTDDDVALSLSLPVLAVIPIMSTRRERQRRRRRRRLAISASLVAMTAALAGAMWMMDDLTTLVR
jgi:polysaccharide chain length determinant protein (PEP-CTERM system associated)